MRKHNKIKFLKAFQFTLLLLVICSCANSNYQKNKSDIPKSAETEIDTTLQLKFTSMVRSIYQDSKGNYWFGSDKEGVSFFDGKSFTYFTKNDGLGHNQVRTIQEDKYGNIWFATGSGVSSYDGVKLTVHARKDSILPIDVQASDWEMKATDLWFNREIEGNGKQEGGIYKYDGKNFKVLGFPLFTEEYDGFKHNGTITGVCKGKNGMLWISSYGGVFGFDGKSFNMINEPDLQYHVRGILEDSKGNLWIGNNGIGVLYYDGDKTTKLSDKKELNSTSEKNFPYHVFTIAEDNNGNIWIGDRDTGAWRYDGKSLENYTTKDGLTSMFVRVIYNDKKGQLWFGMEGGSVCKFNGTSFDKIY